MIIKSNRIHRICSINHRILEFKQEPFLKPELRVETEKKYNKIKKQNAKLRNNATFGKLIENPRTKVYVKIATNRKQYFKGGHLDKPLKDKISFVMDQ